MLLMSDEWLDTTNSMMPRDSTAQVLITLKREKAST
jgi:hypothetical protein